MAPLERQIAGNVNTEEKKKYCADFKLRREIITLRTVYTRCRVKAIGFHSQYTLKKVSFYRKVGQRVFHPFYPPRCAAPHETSRWIET